jgi:hypothetical protein
MRSRIVVAGLVAFGALFVSIALCDTPQSAAVTDPAGDTSVKDAPAYQDIVAADVTRIDAGGGDVYFVLRQTHAGPITADSAMPSNPGGIKEVLFDWGLVVENGTPLPRWPLAGNGHPHDDDIMIWLTWDGDSFVGLLADRRPVFSGGEIVFSEVDFAIDGNDVLLFIPADLIGDPDTFLWRCAVINVTSGNVPFDPNQPPHNGNGDANSNGTWGFNVVDNAGVPFTQFP